MQTNGLMTSKSKSGIGETVRTVIIAVLIALAVRTVAYEPFNIPSESMMPTLLVGDYLFIAKYTYGYSRYSLPFGLPLISGRIFAKPAHRGDVVVFKLPSDDKTDYIKRIVGLPGDTIQVRDGLLYINGTPVKRQRIGDFLYHDRFGDVGEVPQYIETLPNGVSYHIIKIRTDPELDNTPVFHVPPGHYFAMGDNRDDSSDSRISPSEGGVGYIPAANLEGKAEILFFSTNGKAHWWQFWLWPESLRFARFFKPIGGGA